MPRTPNAPGRRPATPVRTPSARTSPVAASPRKRFGAAGAVVLAAGLLAGCGGGEDSGRPDGDAGASAGKTATAQGFTTVERSGPTTDQDLRDLALSGDVAGHRVSARDKANRTDPSDVRTTPELCAPLAALSLGTVTGQPRATAESQAVETGAAGRATRTMITLAAYEDDGARRALDAVDRAAEKCADGFTLRTHGKQIEVLKVAGAQAPDLGDDALAFTLTTEEGPDKAQYKLRLVREGGKLAGFSALNPASVSSGRDFTFPEKLPAAQVERLR